MVILKVEGKVPRGRPNGLREWTASSRRGEELTEDTTDKEPPYKIHEGLLKLNDQNTAQAMCYGGHFFNLSTQEAEADGSL